VRLSHVYGGVWIRKPEMHVNPSDEALRELLLSSATIAIVGASSKAERPSNAVMRILLDAGFRVVPVSPRETEVLGVRAVPSLAAVTEAVDIVDVFRRPEETPGVADEAVAVRARALWLQLGISNEDAAARARGAGLTVVMDLCLGETVRRLGIGRRGGFPPADRLGDGRSRQS
jgi:predicted CoA-binding protein